MASFQDIIQSDKPTLLDFYAEWCGPCQTLAPILTQVKNELGDRVQILKIDVDKNGLLAEKLGVRGVPALFLYKEGQLLWQGAGLRTKTELISELSKHIL